MRTMRQEVIAAQVPPRSRTRPASRVYASARRSRPVRAKHVFFALFGLMTLFVLYRYEVPLMDSHSPAWQHFAKVTWLLLPHGIGGAPARALMAVPAIQAMGEVGLVSVVWSTIAAAYFVPSLVIGWRAVFRHRAASPDAA